MEDEQTKKSMELLGRYAVEAISRFIADQRAAAEKVEQLTEKVKALEERVHTLEDESRGREAQDMMAN